MRTIASTVDGIFAACPELWGFSVTGQFELSDVETHPRLAQPERLMGEIAAALVDLVDEQPEALEQLRGRTFARTLH
jgi:hypothetical protein